MLTSLAFISPGPWEIGIFLVIALLMFGKRLPEVARNMGKGLTEFKKGMRGIEEDVHHSASYDADPTADRPHTDDSLDNVSAPKFEPPTAATLPDDSTADDSTAGDSTADDSTAGDDQADDDLKATDAAGGSDADPPA
ncbi:MAG: twin-arginine translocase TatA/TatE family subunit [Planctomycetaceae bacterium]